LKSIDIAEEQEKYNLYIALTNLESKYGTEDSLEEAFTRALTYNE
jgi:rRNA biogenesis protein RRP5